ncbi:MAG: hypothetical protein IPK65_07065 [Gammaproteobacteria bacterium]|nr:hypothetical protein [Gammaproteobacteria bacterium]
MTLGTAQAAGDRKTVEQVHQHKTELNGQQVAVHGKVVKVNNGIMNKNFLHIQDGTGAADSNDITVTSTDTAEVGDEVTITGTLVVDRDFGAGYVYPVIIEQATISK